jgi:hypothetical protein
MQSQEYTSKVTIRKILDEGDGWPTFKMTIENVDSKAAVLLNKKDLQAIVSETLAVLTDADEENEGGDNA